MTKKKFMVRFKMILVFDDVGWNITLIQLKRLVGRSLTNRWKRTVSDVEGVRIKFRDGSYSSCIHTRSSMEWRWTIPDDKLPTVSDAMEQIREQLEENDHIYIRVEIPELKCRLLPRRSILRCEHFRSVRDVQRAFREGMISEARAVRRLIGLRVPGLVVDVKPGAFKALKKFVTLRASKRLLPRLQSLRIAAVVAHNGLE